MCVFVCKACQKNGNLDQQHRKFNVTDELPIGDGSFSCSRSRRNKKEQGNMSQTFDPHPFCDFLSLHSAPASQHIAGKSSVWDLDISLGA